MLAIAKSLLIIALALYPICCDAQDSQFEVASIRPDAPGAPAIKTNLDLGAEEYFRYQGGPVTADGYLVNYIIFAYKIADPSEYPVIEAQLPKWAQFESGGPKFRLEARGGDHPTQAELRAMVRAMLAERFGLKVHTETRTQMAWVLTRVHGNKSTLRPHEGDSVCAALKPPPTDSASKLPTMKPVPYCGSIISPDKDNRDRVHLQITDYTMQQMAGELAQLEGRMGGRNDLGDLRAVDGTQSTPGKFDLDLHFVRKRSLDATTDETTDTGLDFEQALRSEAGLEFKKEMATVDVFKVDAVKRPTEN